MQYLLNGSAGSSSKHSVNGFVRMSPNAAFEDCGRDGMLLSVDGSLSAATPCRRNGSKWLSTMSSPPFEPVLGRSVVVSVTWFTPPYVVSRYHTSMPGALYGTRSTSHASWR